MFDDYELEVLRDYNDKKAKGVLLSNLMHPTPANLKKECIAVFDRAYSKKDEMVLRSFFELNGHPENYRMTLKRWETDKFRPLNMVLNKGEIKTSEKNIELLAWLIGFEPRPYVAWLKNKGEQPELVIPNVKDDEIEIKVKTPLAANRLNPTQAFFSPIKKPSAWLKVSIIVACFLILGLIDYSLIGINKGRGNQKCMYWKKDHYELIACNEKPADSTLSVIGLDSNKLLRFKRITHPDTLTANSVGKVWYLKIDGSVEYYTYPGPHPLYPGRRLLPLTAYILNKYSRRAE